MKGLEGWERESSDSAVAAPAAELLGNEITFPSSLCSALLSSRLVSHAFRSSSSSLQLLFSPLRSPGKNIYKKKGKKRKGKAIVALLLLYSLKSLVLLLLPSLLTTTLHTPSPSLLPPSFHHRFQPPSPPSSSSSWSAHGMIPYSFG